jgi:NDP-sugar pyrophosphorylase family protein
MILAAGLGTRLRPLTNDRPKALVPVAGRTLLEIALARLRVFGVTEVIINTHHFADMVAGYLRANHNFGMHIELSPEPILLDTGGGLKNAAHFFASNAAPFLLHNVDVISTIDLARMIRFHTEHGALATLAVQHRETSRPLLFDQQGQLRGRAASFAQPATGTPQAFSGIHVISPRIFSLLTEEGAFSIIDAYIRLAAQGESILAFPADQYQWRDLGRPDQIAAAAREMSEGL